jgi:hypothetical protein
MKRLEKDILKKAWDIYNEYLAAYPPGSANDLQPTGGNAWKPYSFMEGRLGSLFFMLELYKNTGDENVWNNILNELAIAESFAQALVTNNYTIQGKLGLGFFYLEVFECTGKKHFLEKADELAREYYNGYSYQYRIISRLSLLDGISGILLFTQRLYLKTKEPWLLEYIEKYLLRIINNAVSANQGIFWGGITNKNRKNIGLATGTAGISFVLAFMGKCFGNSLLVELAEQALLYEFDFWTNASNKDVKELSLGYGLCGLALADLYIGKKDTQQSIDLLLSLSQQQHHHLPAITSYGLFTGMAGTGLGFCEAYRITGNEAYLQEAEQIAEHLLLLSGEKTNVLPLAMEGSLGIGYFLLKLNSVNNDRSGVFFIPAFTTAVKREDLPAQSVFCEGNQEIYLTSVRRHFKHTLSALKEELPDAWNELLKREKTAEVNDLIAYIKGVINNIQDVSQINSLLFNFERENFVLSIMRSVKEPVLYDDNVILETDNLLKLPAEKFIQLTLRHSEKTWVFSKDASLENAFTKGSFGNFLQQYGTKTFLYKVSDGDNLQVSVPGILKLIFDRFSMPVAVADARNQIAHFLLMQNEEVVGFLKSYYGAGDKDQLMAIINEMTMDGIKYCLMEGFLEVTG